MRIVIKDKRYLGTAAKKILGFAGGKRILAFHGAMGSGKTTIIRSICRALGATDVTSSPSFTIVNEYRTKNGEFLYHIDFYRIKKEEEIYDIGIEEYLSGSSWCFIEWPELAGRLIPPETVNISITVGPNGQRMLDLS